MEIIFPMSHLPKNYKEARGSTSFTILYFIPTEPSKDDNRKRTERLTTEMSERRGCERCTEV